MTFDQAYEEYKKARGLLREAQGELAKLLHQREKTDKEIKELVRKYKTRYTTLIRAQDILKPELDKEVASHSKPSQYESAQSEEDRKVAEIEADIAEKETAAEKNQPAESADNGKADENGQTEGQQK